MRLLRYRVTNFRSVADSGWLGPDDVTALIGVNESGKSNLLLPLWTLGQGWKVELSKRVKQHLLAKGIAVVKQERADRWQRRFDTLGSSAANSRA